MKKQILVATGALVLVAVPAVIGLWGNASFAQSVPVRVPVSGQVVTATPTATPTPTPSASVDDDGVTDDHGGDVPRDQRTEPGDDRRVNGGGIGGGDDHGGDDHGGDDDGGGRHGGDDRGGDDHGGDD